MDAFWHPKRYEWSGLERRLSEGIGGGDQAVGDRAESVGIITVPERCTDC